MNKISKKNIPDELIESLRRGRCAIFVGAGLSIGAGLPSWRELITELIDLAKRKANLDSKKEAELRKLLSNESKFLLLAEELRELLPNEISKYITDRFDNSGVKPTAAHLKLMQLPYKFIITTNYDPILEKAFIDVYKDVPTVYTYEDPASINYAIHSEKTFILKAHGDAKKAPQNIILTEKDYRKILFREKGYQSILEVVFSTFNVLFLGVSFSDPEINLLLGYIHNIFHGGSPEHFALMNEKQITNVELDRWRKDFKINVIPYNPKDNHVQIEQFLDILKKSI